jgi:hypothetical protein
VTHADERAIDSISPPVIVVGMHRSGTGLVTRALAENGLFIGARTDKNFESLFFKRLNNWLLQLAGSSWMFPARIDVLLNNDAASALVVEQLRRILRSPMARRYLGWTGWLRHRRSWLPFPWGWKDPRTTFTLPLWLKIFPDAIVVNVERHGVDVAASLRAQSARDLDKAGSLLRQPSWMLVNRRQLVRFTGGLRVNELYEGLALWSLYVRRARAHVERAGRRAITIRYEELLANEPSATEAFQQIATLAKLPRANAPITDPTRSMAWTHVPELASFAEGNSELLAQLGYGAPS